MLLPRIYVDTSVIGGCFDDEFEDASRRLFDQSQAGDSIIVISDLTLLELQGAPEQVQAVLDSVPDAFFEEVIFTAEASELAERYLAAGVVGEANRTDARHIATATVHHVTVLVSWNLRHIVNLNRIHGYNSVNIRYGYAMLEIRTPREVIGNGNGEEV